MFIELFSSRLFLLGCLYSLISQCQPWLSHIFVPLLTTSCLIFNQTDFYAVLLFNWCYFCVEHQALLFHHTLWTVSLQDVWKWTWQNLRCDIFAFSLVYIYLTNKGLLLSHLWNWFYPWKVLSFVFKFQLLLLAVTHFGQINLWFINDHVTYFCKISHIVWNQVEKKQIKL